MIVQGPWQATAAGEPSPQADIDEIILSHQRMLAEGSDLTDAPATATCERPMVDLTEVNEIQDHHARAALVAAEVLQRGDRVVPRDRMPEGVCEVTGTISCVMSPEGYLRVLSRLRAEQREERRLFAAKQARLDAELRGMRLEPLVQVWPLSGGR